MHSRRICIVLALREGLSRCVLALVGVVLFKLSISLLLFYLVVLAVIENGALNSPTTIAELVISPLTLSFFAFVFRNQFLGP